MSAKKIPWSAFLRLAIGLALLVWILNSIFLREGSKAWENHQPAWESLSNTRHWAIAWTLGPGQLWGTLKQITWGYLTLSLVVVGSTILFGLIRWNLALKLQGLNLSLARVTEISLVAQFFNAFLLGSTGGDLFKAHYAARETHHKKIEAVVTVVIDRLIGLFAMLLFACVMMWPNRALLKSDGRLLGVAATIFAMMIGCTVVLGLSLRSGLTGRGGHARRGLRRLPKGEAIERGIDASRQFGHSPAYFFKSLAFSMLLNLACVAHVAVLARGLGVTISFVALMAIVPAIICISALPFSLSGLGIRENLFVLMLGAPQLNIDHTVALSLSLFSFAGTLFWSLIGGIVYFSRREKDHLAEVDSDV